MLTTGTGSGKSLAYIVPIVDHVLRNGSGKGIQAIVVYPMNALANSQAGELEKFLSFGPWAGGRNPITGPVAPPRRCSARLRVLDAPLYDGKQIHVVLSSLGAFGAIGASRFCGCPGVKSSVALQLGGGKS